MHGSDGGKEIADWRVQFIEHLVGYYRVKDSRRRLYNNERAEDRIDYLKRLLFGRHKWNSSLTPRPWPRKRRY